MSVFARITGYLANWGNITNDFGHVGQSTVFILLGIQKLGMTSTLAMLVAPPLWGTVHEGVNALVERKKRRELGLPFWKWDYLSDWASFCFPMAIVNTWLLVPIIGLYAWGIDRKVLQDKREAPILKVAELQNG